MGRTIDYTYTNTETMSERLYKYISKFKGPDPDELLSGVTDPTIRAAMEEEFKIINNIANDLTVATRDDLGNEKNEIIGKLMETIDNMKLGALLEEYKAKTNYEFVRDKNYDKLTQLAEYIAQLKIEAKYVKTETIEISIHENRQIKEKRFSADFKKFFDDELSLSKITQKKEAYEEEIKNEQKNLENLGIEKKEKQQKLQETKELYNVLQDLQNKKENLESRLGNFKDYQEKVNKHTNALKTAENKKEELSKRADELEAESKRYEKEINLLGQLLDEQAAKQEELNKLYMEGTKESEWKEAADIWAQASNKLMDVALKNGIPQTIIEEAVQHKIKCEQLKREQEALSKEQEALDKESKELESTKLQKEDLEKQLNKVEMDMQIHTKDIQGFKVSESKEGISKIKNAIDTYEKQWGEDGFRKKQETCEIQIRNLNTKLDTVKKAEEKVSQLAVDYFKIKNSQIDEARELMENQREFQNEMIKQFAEFRDHIFDASKSATQNNSVEFMNMKKELDEMMKLKNASFKTYMDQVDKVKKSAETYLEAKERQIRLLPSTQRVVRMKFAKQLIGRCERAQKKDYGLEKFGTKQETKDVIDNAARFQMENKDVLGKSINEQEYVATANKVFDAFCNKQVNQPKAKENMNEIKDVQKEITKESTKEIENIAVSNR